jgi:hypothetical protein
MIALRSSPHHCDAAQSTIEEHHINEALQTTAVCKTPDHLMSMYQVFGRSSASQSAIDHPSSDQQQVFALEPLQ